MMKKQRGDVTSQVEDGSFEVAIEFIPVTLLDVIDKTISPMGGRLLKRWLALPLKDVKKIQHKKKEN